MHPGNRKSSEPRTAPKLASDLTSCKINSSEEDMWQNSKRSTGIPVKKLMAEEMAKEVEVRRRSPSVIARLMGFDGSESPQPSRRQSKMLYDSMISIGLQKIGQHTEGQSNIKGSIEHHQFKDVHEDLEASHASDCRYSSKWKANLNFIKPEPTFNRQKLMDAKGLSTNERLNRSKEFYDTPEMLDRSNKLPLKISHYPDSLFEKHLEDLQGDSPSSVCSHIAILKPAYSAKYEEGNAEDWKSDREAIHMHMTSSYKKREDGLLLCYNDYGAQDSSKVQPERKDRKCALPRRIVILKPNIEKMQDTGKSVPLSNSSHDYFPEFMKSKKYSSISAQEAKSWSSECRSQEAKAIAQEITGQMIEYFKRNNLKLLTSRTRGYAGDESSCYLSGSDSASDSQGLMVAPRHSFDFGNLERSSSSGSTVSSVSREAKMRLSERWKMAHQSQDMRVTGKLGTLGEMLAIPDREFKSANLDDIIYPNTDRSRRTKSDGSSGWESPLGISSRDGWKDGHVRNSCRSRSLPPSLDIRNSQNSSHEAPSDTYFMIKEAGKCRSKTIKGRIKGRSFNHKEDHSSRRIRTRSSKSHSSHRTCGDSGSFHDIRVIPIQVVGNLDKKEPLEQDLSTCILGKGNSSVCEPEESALQETSTGFSEEGSVLVQSAGPESESSESCKTAGHPSPVSVLEVPCADDASINSECFQSVGAGLRELRMQLQLLKMESKSYVDEPMLNSSVEDIGQGLLTRSEDRDITISRKEGAFKAESWQSSYLFDVLIDSGLDYMDLNAFMKTWHSPDCPLDPWIFHNLEKKYTDEQPGLQVERKLLFDYLNSAILELYQRFMDPWPWVKASGTRAGPKMSKNGLIDELYKLLDNQQTRTNDIISEKVLDQEMHWLDTQEHADVIVMEIEKLVIEDLLTEVLATM